MRRSVLFMLLAATSIVVGGCRQTAGPNVSGPLTPLAPTTMSPVGAGNAPTLGPFGGPTRVTPPATGSYVAPNNYMGGAVAPAGQTDVGTNSVGGFVNRGDQVVGSGVHVAGFNESNSQPQNSGSVAGGQVPSLTPSDPRSGGMRVIDLTGTPPPPGYLPQPQAAPPNSFRGQSPTTNFVPQNQSSITPGSQAGFQPVQIPSPGRIAGNPSPTPMSEIPTNTAPIGSAVPTTQPITPSSDLPWRRPGTQY